MLQVWNEMKQLLNSNPNSIINYMVLGHRNTNYPQKSTGEVLRVEYFLIKIRTSQIGTAFFIAAHVILRFGFQVLMTLSEAFLLLLNSTCPASRFSPFLYLAQCWDGGHPESDLPCPQGWPTQHNFRLSNEEITGGLIFQDRCYSEIKHQSTSRSQ